MFNCLTSTHTHTRLKNIDKRKTSKNKQCTPLFGFLCGMAERSHDRNAPSAEHWTAGNSEKTHSLSHEKKKKHTHINSKNKSTKKSVKERKKGSSDSSAYYKTAPIGLQYFDPPLQFIHQIFIRLQGTGPWQTLKVAFISQNHPSNLWGNSWDSNQQHP